jgi:Xaa-Pro aminopeptidase
MEGYIPFKTWSYIRQNLPRATFIDISAAFFELMLTRSAEELALARYAAGVGEMVCETMLKTTKIGAGEAEIFAAMMQTMYSNGCNPRMLVLESGSGNFGWHTPLWLHKAGVPRTIKEGEMVQAEIFAAYGGIETQQQMSIAIKPVASINRELARIARRSYEIGVRELRPGNTFGDVAKAMAAPLAEEKCWHLCPLIHSVSPQMCGSQLQIGMTGLPGLERYGNIPEIPVRHGEIVLKPGMLFELEPNPGRGRDRVVVGGTVLVTEYGAEELNSIGTTMHELD